MLLVIRADSVTATMAIGVCFLHPQCVLYLLALARGKLFTLPRAACDGSIQMQYELRCACEHRIHGSANASYNISQKRTKQKCRPLTSQYF